MTDQPPITWVTTSYDPIIPCTENKLLGTPTLIYKNFAFVTDREYKCYTGRVIVYKLVDKIWKYYTNILPPEACYDFGNAICSNDDFLFVSASVCYSPSLEAFKNGARGMVHTFKFDKIKVKWTYNGTIYPTLFSTKIIHNTGINISCISNTLVIGYASDYDRETNQNYNGGFVVYKKSMNSWVYNTTFVGPSIKPPTVPKIIPRYTTIIESSCKLIGIPHFCCCEQKYINDDSIRIRQDVSKIEFNKLITTQIKKQNDTSKEIEPKMYFGINNNKITGRYIFSSYKIDTTPCIDIFRYIIGWNFSNRIEFKLVDPTLPYEFSIVDMPMDTLTNDTLFVALKISDKYNPEIIYGYTILIFYKNSYTEEWAIDNIIHDYIDIITPSPNLYMAASTTVDNTPFLFVTDYLKTSVYSAPVSKVGAKFPYGNWYLYQEIQNQVCTNDTELLAKYVSIFGDYSLITFSNNLTTLFIYSFSGGDPHVVTIFNEKYLLPKGSNHFNLFTDTSINLSIQCYCDYLDKTSFPSPLYIHNNYVDITGRDDLEIFTNTYYRKFSIIYGDSNFTIDADTLEVLGVIGENVKITHISDDTGLYSITYSLKYPKNVTFKSILVELGEYKVTLVSDISTDERHYVKLKSDTEIMIKNLSGALVAESPKNIISGFTEL
jgi:hypothetical protein